MARTTFCRERGYSAWSLRCWEKQLGVAGATAEHKPAKLAKFAAVTVHPAQSPISIPTTASVRLRLPMGVEIEAATLPSAEWMADVLLRLRQEVAS